MAGGKPGSGSTVASGMIPVRRLNHAVLYVRDADRAAAFYQEAFGFEVVQRIPGVAAFLKAAGTTNHHDLGLFSVGANAPGPERGRVGLYHLAWEVPSIHDLAAGRETLAPRCARRAERPRRDEVALWPGPRRQRVRDHVARPREQWGDLEHEASTDPLDLDAELARWG